MDNFESLPKSVKKALRYIHQDASLEQLQSIKILINKAVNRRRVELNKYTNVRKVGDKFD